MKHQELMKGGIMMKRYLTLFSALILLLALSGLSHAYSINYLYDTDGNNFISPYSGVIVEDFEGSLLWTWTGSYHVLTGDVSGVASAPFGDSTKDTTKYVSVPKDVNDVPQSVAVTNLGGLYNYFGLWWGSVDTYNTLTFYNNGTEVASFTGTSITTPNAANGDQTAPSTNLYVNFLDLPLFNSFEMTSTQYAFEADNLAIGVVPEPTTLLLLGFGLLGLAGFRRKE